MSLGSRRLHPLSSFFLLNSSFSPIFPSQPEKKRREERHEPPITVLLVDRPLAAQLPAKHEPKREQRQRGRDETSGNFPSLQTRCPRGVSTFYFLLSPFYFVSCRFSVWISSTVESPPPSIARSSIAVSSLRPPAPAFADCNATKFIATR